MDSPDPPNTQTRGVFLTPFRIYTETYLNELDPGWQHASNLPSLNDLTEHCVLGRSTKKVLKSTLKRISAYILNQFLNQMIKDT